MLIESQGKLEKSQGKVREKSGNSVSKIWQTPSRGHHVNVVSYLGKILIRGLRGIKCQKFMFLDIFSETGH